jgi:AraC-like DNA-binding protein
MYRQWDGARPDDSRLPADSNLVAVNLEHDAARFRRVSTMLTPDERLRIDAAGLGWIRAYHRDTVDDLRRDLQNERSCAVILSTAMCQGISVAVMAKVVREFPRVPTVALLSQLDRSTVRTVLSLGQCGVRTLIDVREPNGWRELRTVLLSERSSTVQRIAMSRLSLDLHHATAGAQRFFETLFAIAGYTPTIRELACQLKVIPGTLMSRFFRARLPAPKQYLTLARLVYAARLFENPGVSISGVSNQLEYSSPQSFSRHVRAVLGLSPLQFRTRYDGDGMLDLFRERLVLGYREQWRAFDPLLEAPRPLRGRKARSEASSPALAVRDAALSGVPGVPGVPDVLGDGNVREDLASPGERYN